MSPFLHLFTKQTQVQLTYSAPNILIKCYYDSASAPIRLILEKWPELEGLRAYFSNGGDTQCVLPVDRLEEARERFHELQRKFQRQSKIQLSIDDKTASFLIRNSPPEDFVVRYQREGEYLKRVLPGNVTETKDGWLLRGFEFWHYPALDEARLKLFQNGAVAQEELLSYTKDHFPLFRRAGIRIESEIEYSDAPAVQLQLRDIDFHSVHLLPQWNVAPETIDESVRIPGYVVSGRFLCSGILPGDIKQVLPDVKQEAELRQDAIAEFLDHWYIPWKPWINGNFALFDALHHWLRPPFHWILNARPKFSNGIGKAFAYPIACIASERMTVQELQAAQERKYYHFSSGWVRQADLLSLGLNREGTLIGSISAKPIRLDAEQMLYRGGKKLDVLWRGLKADGPEWIAKASKHTCAEKHLEYLTQWGINGGLTGGYEAFVAYGMPALMRKAREYRDCCILVLGNQEDIEHLKKQYHDMPGIAAQFYFETYDRIAQRDELRKMKWDVEVLLEPESRFSADARKNIAARSSESGASCKLCFPYKFTEAPENKDCGEWIASLLGYRKKTALAHYFIRDCREKKALPDAYVFQGQLPEAELSRPIKAWEGKTQKHIPGKIQPGKAAGAVRRGAPDHAQGDPRLEQEAFVQISVDGPEESHGVPIPPKRENIRFSEPPSLHDQPYIDFEKVEQLRQESDDIRDALLSSVKQAEQEEKALPPIAPPAGTPEGLLTDLAPVQKILDRLSASELNLLSLLRGHQWRMDRDLIAKTYKKMMTDAVMDAINALSMEHLGCFLLEQEGNEVVVAEDYRDELDYLTAQTAEKKTEWTFLANGLEEEWISFFSGVDMDALAAILDGNEALNEYARKQGKMPEVIRDTVNHLAQDTIGDLLLNEDGIYEDYIEIIQTHLIKE